MKKILLLSTGGTIASVPGENGLAPKMSADELLHYLPEQNRSYQVETKIIMTIDSTNMQPEYWVTIAKAVYEHYDQYDGFVITHGTDTMAYTSAALSYMLQNLGKPVVITGSQVPIVYKRTDAKKNIIDAIRFACEPVGGVYVVFDGRVIIGTRAVKMRTKSYDAFESINHPYIAYIEESITYHHPVRTVRSKEPGLDCSLCPDVFLLKLLPGTKPELFDYLKGLYKGVVIETFGSGGLPFQERNLIPKINELIDAGIAVALTTQCLEEGGDLGLYEVGRKVNQDLIINSRDMNTEAIVPKFMWALGKTTDLTEVKKIMETVIAGDTTP
ncbi:asparaginase [Paenibacillus oleatilyticus]|uniref:asparaginase n=1 Tax=Paenibacillus oleatilyticus TaxID=2594886 RepID=UPI001C1F5DDD|nr:asparaginase [Paenibacillus oleatilyticus]MBU7314665.1 asparaginase [Paenibacillus oleatilyticus]